MDRLDQLVYGERVERENARTTTLDVSAPIVEAETSGGATLIDRSVPRGAAIRTVFEGADIDEYRERYGKADGERRFFAEHAPSTCARDADALDEEPLPFDFDDIGPLDSVYIDTSQFL